MDGSSDGSTKKGNLFILSAPSGAGKTTLCRAVLAQYPEIKYSVSSTTRAPRKGEEDGKDYFFVTEEKFLSGIHQGKWAEWAKVHDHYYGTDADFIKTSLSRGEDILLDIDVQGTLQILKEFPRSVSIFIMPPSREALETRMTARGTDSPEVIAKRMRNAEEEMTQRDLYCHIIINRDLDEAIAELTHLIESFQRQR
ncbi:MAG: guanylate kinase [Proteobacteria bacterium]|nr:guanylate kinase [Pseudomonadota bacterium]MBU4469964.1 guanylate kinase [Pseudomonadota bacterium]